MRTLLRNRHAARTLAVTFAALAAAIVGLAAPAHAQYGGGGITFFTDPRVPIDDTFSVFGSGCAAGETVVITIDGVPGTVATTTASAAGNYSISDIDLPLGLIAGDDYDVRATCGPETATAIMTLLCHDGELPVDGNCLDGSDGTVGGVGPTTTTTTVAPDDDGSGGTTGGVPGDDTSSDGSGGSSGDGSSPALAITGASFTELLVQSAVTLFAVGFLLVLVARRRRTEPASL
ncbi:MAG: hypothetical protein AAGA90_12450 [Actinomycetota bacterium]